MRQTAQRFLPEYRQVIYAILNRIFEGEVSVLYAGRSSLNYCLISATGTFLLKVKPENPQKTKELKPIPAFNPIDECLIEYDNRFFEVSKWPYTEATLPYSEENAIAPETVANVLLHCAPPFIHVPQSEQDTLTHCKNMLRHIKGKSDNLKSHTLGGYALERLDLFYTKGMNLINSFKHNLKNCTAGIIHGDPTPNNYLISKNKEPVWVDYEDSHYSNRVLGLLYFIMNWLKAGSYTGTTSIDAERLALAQFISEIKSKDYLFFQQQELEVIENNILTSVYFYHFYQSLIYLDRAVDMRWELKEDIGFKASFEKTLAA